MSAPTLSVVMPVHNAAPYLDRSLGSILGQTFRDFELIVLENGSTDESREIVRRYADADRRIRLYEHPEPLGMVASSNKVTSKARAPLVARMDADDVSRPDRLERQLEVMRHRDDVVVVGTLCDGIDAEGRQVRPRDRWRLLRCPEVPFAHGSAMFRLGAFESVGGYRDGTPLGQDVELFLRLADHGCILVLPEALYRYRYRLDNTTVSTSLDGAARSKDLLWRSLAERRAGRDHAGVLEAGPHERPGSSIKLGALYYQGANRLWAGAPPRILGELVRGGCLKLDRASLKTFVWAAWASISPATLRSFLRFVVRARDLAAAVRISDGRTYEWRLR